MDQLRNSSSYRDIIGNYDIPDDNLTKSTRSLRPSLVPSSGSSGSDDSTNNNDIIISSDKDGIGRLKSHASHSGASSRSSRRRRSLLSEGSNEIMKNAARSLGSSPSSQVSKNQHDTIENYEIGDPSNLSPKNILHKSQYLESLSNNDSSSKSKNTAKSKDIYDPGNNEDKTEYFSQNHQQPENETNNDEASEDSDFDDNSLSSGTMKDLQAIRTPTASSKTHSLRESALAYEEEDSEETSTSTSSSEGEKERDDYANDMLVADMQSQFRNERLQSFRDPSSELSNIQNDSNDVENGEKGDSNNSRSSSAKKNDASPHDEEEKSESNIPQASEFQYSTTASVSVAAHNVRPSENVSTSFGITDSTNNTNPMLISSSFSSQAQQQKPASLRGTGMSGTFSVSSRLMVSEFSGDGELTNNYHVDYQENERMHSLIEGENDDASTSPRNQNIHTSSEFSPSVSNSINNDVSLRRLSASSLELVAKKEKEDAVKLATSSGVGGVTSGDIFSAQNRVQQQLQQQNTFIESQIQQRDTYTDNVSNEEEEDSSTNDSSSSGNELLFPHQRRSSMENSSNKVIPGSNAGIGILPLPLQEPTTMSNKVNDDNGLSNNIYSDGNYTSQRPESPVTRPIFETELSGNTSISSVGILRNGQWTSSRRYGSSNYVSSGGSLCSITEDYTISKKSDWTQSQTSQSDLPIKSPPAPERKRLCRIYFGFWIIALLCLCSGLGIFIYNRIERSKNMNSKPPSIIIPTPNSSSVPPSLSPSMDLFSVPSLSPSISNEPTVSNHPSFVPSTTTSPSGYPSEGPSLFPSHSNKPSFFPSSLPSREPSANKVTDEPTASSTITKIPTKNPSTILDMPTKSPSNTDSPTTQTKAPSDTDFPTKTPSNTFTPTESPISIIQPTRFPSSTDSPTTSTKAPSDTDFPTNIPTESPISIAQPTMFPSNTYSPTKSPSETDSPTTKTKVPSVTNFPTNTPSKTVLPPSKAPSPITSFPTTPPSEPVTVSPTKLPSNRPTVYPVPTTIPTSSTVIPTRFPTPAPFAVTDYPTTKPTKMPIVLDSQPPSKSSPTMMPTEDPKYEAYIDILIQVSSEESLKDPYSPQREALDWIIDTDEMQLKPEESEALIQRYICALFYFSTSSNKLGERTQWQICDPSEGDEPCFPSIRGTDLIIDNIMVNRKAQRTSQKRQEISLLTKLQQQNTAADTTMKYPFLSKYSECEWYGIFCNQDNNYVEKWIIEENNLRGVLPKEISYFSNLTEISLDRNYLRGEIPHELSNLSSNLERLSLSRNEFSGPLSIEFKQLNKLKYLSLKSNYLNSTLSSDLFNNGALCSSLTYLDISANKFFGSIPNELYDNCKLLNYLDISSNKFAGLLSTNSASFADMPRLKSVFMSNNRFTGTIPSSLFVSTVSTSNFMMRNNNRLKHLSLSLNYLNGTIPESLFTSSYHLEYLDLGANHIRGTLSTNFGLLKNVEQLVLWTNQLSGTVPTEIGNLEKLEILHLADNNLSGEIPEEICSLGLSKRTSVFSPIENTFNISADCAGAIPEIECSCCNICEY